MRRSTAAVGSWRGVEEGRRQALEKLSRKSAHLQRRLLVHVSSPDDHLSSFNRLASYALFCFSFRTFFGFKKFEELRIFDAGTKNIEPTNS
jgi:hypothetical protein